MPKKKEVKEEVKTTVIEQDKDETANFWAERQKNMTAEEMAEVEEREKRFNALSAKGRVARVEGMCETPEIVLEKMNNGFKELHRLPVDDVMLDTALSTQASRFLALASFFESRNTKFPDETNLEIAEMLRRLGERVEAFRMPLLEKGDKSELLKIADASGQAMKVIEVLWKKEDADG
jgi:hypothetical protein